MLKKGVCIIFTFFLLISCSKKNETVTNSVTQEWDGFIVNPIVVDGLAFNLEDDYTIERCYIVESYIIKFLNIFPKILENKSEVEYAVCQMMHVPDHIYERVGWTKTIQVKIKIKENTALPSNWDIAGAELYYFLGSGRLPGCIMQTKQEHLFSGFLNESQGLAIDYSLTGIDAITPYTIKEQTPKTTAKTFRQKFREQFIKFGGRQLGAWSGTEMDVLNIEDNLKLVLFLVEDDDTLLDIYLRIADAEKPLKNKDDFYIALCAMISIVEPYLEENKVEQFAKTLEDTLPYLEGYRMGQKKSYEIERYWMPSGNYYNAILNGDSALVDVTFEYEVEG